MCIQVNRQPPQEGENVENTEEETLKFKLVTLFRVLRERIMQSGQRLMSNLHVYEIMEESAIYLAQHPIMTVIFIAVAISCGIPILMFAAFAILTVLFTFAGFIVIEGTILTVGSVLLCGFVLAILIILVTIAATVGVAYLGFVEIYGLLQNSPENSALAHFLPRKKENQHPFVSTTSDQQHED